MKKEQKFAKYLIDFIDESHSVFHVVKKIEEILIKEGFKKVKFQEKWKLEKEGKYYIIKNNSAIIGFIIGKGEIEKDGFKLIGTHTDYPTFKVKPDPEITVEGKYLKLNTEVYGGPILSTWFDRPLSMAGRVTIKTDNLLKPEQLLIDMKKPIMVIPNLAIHMNRKVNEGVEINPQIHTLPLLTMINENIVKDNFLMGLIAENIDVNIEDILDLELFLYGTEKGTLVGHNRNLFLLVK